MRGRAITTEVGLRILVEELKHTPRQQILQMFSQYSEDVIDCCRLGTHRALDASYSPPKRGAASRFTAADERWLARVLDEDPDQTERELAVRFARERKKPCSATSIWRLRKRINYPLHTFSWRPSAGFAPEQPERERAYVRRTRHIPLTQRVYFDEVGIDIRSGHRKGKAPPGSTLYRVGYDKPRRVTALMAIDMHGVRCCHVVTKTVNDEVFKNFVNRSFCRKLKPDEYVFWDNLGRSGRSEDPCKLHFNPDVALKIERITGHPPVHLPSYGCDFNPIEAFFHELKSAIHRLPPLEMNNVHGLARRVKYVANRYRNHDMSKYFAKYSFGSK